MKKLIKNILIYCRYLLYRYVLYRDFRNVVIARGVKIEKVFAQRETLFGYYNLSPENRKGEILGSDISLQPDVAILLKNGEKTDVIGKTGAFNFQQGSMLQWNYENDNLLYYNRFNKEKDCYECVCCDTLLKEEVDILPRPVCCISRDGRYALSLNFERLSVMRPDYGYFCRKDVTLPDLEDDGIWRIDMKTKDVNLILTLAALRDFQYVDTMDGANHKVNHIDIAPDGKRFMFLHRWVGPKGRFMRLMTADENGQNLYILNGDKMTSHSCWYDNHQILSFCYTPEYGNAYTSFVDMTNHRELISKDLPTEDGHPSVSPNKKWMITDSYPGLSRMSKLWLMNLETKQLILLGRFYQPLRYNGTKRIDLHPKWNLQGDKIYFESGHNGYRNLYCLNINCIVNGE